MTSKINTSSRTKMKAGERHARLTAVAFVMRNKWGDAIWKWKCDCGKEHETAAGRVRSGNTKSCGCLSSETAAANGKACATHGMRGSREYGIWASMIQRCYNSRDTGYHYYGARGIDVCERWRESFEEFYIDMGARPSKDHSIDRIDNDGPYCKENCKWSTRKEQHRNKRNSRKVVVDGIEMTVAEAAERAGVNYGIVRDRVARAWPIDRAISTPARRIQKRGAQ